MASTYNALDVALVTTGHAYPVVEENYSLYPLYINCFVCIYNQTPITHLMSLYYIYLNYLYRVVVKIWNCHPAVATWQSSGKQLISVDAKLFYKKKVLFGQLLL